MGQGIITTFILGAGASNSYGMPLGPQLIEQIIGYSSSKYPDLYAKLDARSPYSIDSFLADYDEKSEIVKSGKDAIANILLNAHNSNHMTYSNKAHWMKHLFNRLHLYFKKHNYEPADLPIRIITFNYDLTFELYVEQFLNSCDFVDLVKRRRIRALFGQCILHVYGQIGVFDWQKDFYKKHHPDVVLNEAHIIAENEHFPNKFDPVFDAKTYYNGSHVSASLIRLIRSDHSDIVRHTIREWLGYSHAAIFMGYGFHNDNNDLFFDRTGEFKRFHNIGIIAATAKDVNPRTLHKIISLLSEKTASDVAGGRGISLRHYNAKALNQSNQLMPFNYVSAKQYRGCRIVDDDCESFLRDEVDLDKLILGELEFS